MGHPAISTVLAAFLLMAVGLCRNVDGADRGSDSAQSPAVTAPVWPSPPDPARIRFVRSVDGPSDWDIARSWWGRVVDTLTGRQETRFVRPTGVAERDGVLYVADPGAQCLVVLDAPRRRELRIARVGDRMLVSPVAVAPGPHETVFVADSWLREVLQLDASGKLVRAIAHDDLQRPSSVVFDPARGRLYVGDSKAHVVHVFDPEGRKLSVLGRHGSEPGEFNSPTHLALASDGSIFVTDALNFRVEVFGVDGQYRTYLGEIGDGAGNFASPKGVAVDRDGHVYVADAMFDTVQVFDVAGRLLLGFGQQGTQAGQFWIPNGLYIDGDDRLYVADAYNHRIQVFQLLLAVANASTEERGQAQ